MTPEFQTPIVLEEKEQTYDQKLEALLKTDQQHLQKLLERLKAKEISPADFFASMDDRTQQFREKLSEIQKSMQKVPLKNDEPSIFSKNLVHTLSSADNN